MFIHLHNHSHYSILEWLPKPAEYVKKAKELKMEAIALTDTWNLHWCHEFFKACKSEWIKAILWTELLVESTSQKWLIHKLVLLAKSYKWYKNIINLTTIANLKDDWKARISFQELVDNVDKNSDIICLSWPKEWEIPFFILSWKEEVDIVDRIKKYQEIFWEENYFLELLYHDDIPKQNFITDELIKISKKYNISVVATNNCFYINKEDKNTQDVISALRTGHEVENPDRPTLVNWDYSFLTEEEMQALFGFIPEALENTKKIADMIDIDIKTWWVLIPKFELPEEHQKIFEEAIELEKNDKTIKKLSSDEWYLRYLSFSWLNWRYNYNLDKQTIFEFVKKLDKPWLDKKLTETNPEELKELSLTYYTDEKKSIMDKLDKEIVDKIDRLEYELVVVHEMWFDAYFLIVADYINRARDHDIPVWPWRWSAAWSLMAYLSWITDIDPLPYKLLFERFLNPARVSMPDIDTDFSDDARDKVIEYCRNKYWADHVAQICTFGTFAARAAVKDVWRVYWIPFSEMNSLASLIPEKPWTKLKWALEDSVEFREAYDNWFYKDEKTWKIIKYKEIIDSALKIEWNVRQLWVHACAVIIAPEPMTNFTALQHPPKDNTSIVTQYSAYPLEDLGLLKMDFLWLRNLTIIQRTVKIIEAKKGIKLDILKIDLDDPKVFKIFADWDTTWVFQFESDWMRKYLKDLAPDSFEDLIAMVSLYRPWPLAYIPTYIDRKYGREEIEYMTSDLIEIMKNAWYDDKIIEEQKKLLEDDLKQILDVTYWIAVYQEQLMFIVQYMAGFSLWEADLLRRWVWKKKIEVVEALKKEFIEKWAKHRWYKPEVTKYIYEEMIQPAANYSFNKSHAACYAFIAYQTAFLKAYYITEFLASTMTSDEENMDRIVLEVSEAESKWINILAPNINESLKHFTYIDDKNIRFWLKAIKWIGDWPIEKIIEARKNWNKYKDLEDFIKRVGKEVINKKSLEALIKAGAMDELWERGQLFASIPAMINFVKRQEKESATSQMWLFESMWVEVDDDKLKLEKVSDFSFEEKLAWEKEMLGFRISWHPLDWLWKYCARRSNNTKKLKISMEELLELDKKQNPDPHPLAPSPLKGEGEQVNKTPTQGKNKEEQKKEKKPKKKEKDEIVSAVWVISDLRKIITKTGKTMVFLKCEWFDYDFEVVIFPKDVEKYIDKLDIDKIIIVNWILNINFEYNRKSIQARDIKIATISQVREQAFDLWLFDNKKRFLNLKLNEVAPLQDREVENNTPHPLTHSLLKGEGEQVNCENKCEIYSENFDKKLEEKIEKNNNSPIIPLLNNRGEENSRQLDIKEFIIEIPKKAKKQDLLDLKQFLSGQTSGQIQIFINLKWQKIDTKFSLDSLENLKKWIGEKW